MTSHASAAGRRGGRTAGAVRRFVARTDRFTLLLLATVALATVAPARGEAARAAGWATTAAIALLFFLHGAKLSRRAVMDGIGAWRLHLAVLAATFAMFPVLGLLVRLVPGVKPEVGAGVLYLCLLPSTVQSSIAFTGIARGNVPAAVCSASASNLLGVFVTPVLVGLLMPGWTGHGGGGVSLSAIGDILLQLMLPFLLGHLSRPWTAGLLERRRAVLDGVDRGSILMVVYTAFSAAVVEGLWRKLSAADLGVVVVLDLVVLAAALACTRAAARAAGFSKPDEIALVFCGSKKSLASGAPMAAALFPAASAGVLITPLMLFHQFQLLACAAIARRYAARAEPGQKRSGDSSLAAPAGPPGGEPRAR